MRGARLKARSLVTAVEDGDGAEVVESLRVKAKQIGDISSSFLPRKLRLGSP